MGGQIAATIQSYGTPQVGAYIGISNLVMISIFIYAVAPASGGHMNPLITFAAVLTGLCSVPRGMCNFLCIIVCPPSCVVPGSLLSEKPFQRAAPKRDANYAYGHVHEHARITTSPFVNPYLVS